MTVFTQFPAALPTWLPENARLYLRHTEAGQSIRAIARTEGCHPSTILRRVRAFENRRDDPLIDEALNRLGRLHIQRAGPDQTRPDSATAEKQEGLDHMSAPIRSNQIHTTDEAALEREARRILRRLCEIGGRSRGWRPRWRRPPC